MKETQKSVYASARGQMLVMMAATLTGVLGIAALSIDAAFMYDKRNRLHAAADDVAKSLAIEGRRQAGALTQGAMNAFADDQAASHGFVSTRLGGPTTVTARRCTDAGATCAAAFQTSSFFEAVL